MPRRTSAETVTPVGGAAAVCFAGARLRVRVLVLGDWAVVSADSAALNAAGVWARRGSLLRRVAIRILLGTSRSI
jgi:hypothetical protein